MGGLKCLILSEKKVSDHELLIIERFCIDDSTNPSKVSLIYAVKRREPGSIIKICDASSICLVVSELRIVKSHLNLLILCFHYSPTTLRSIIGEAASEHY